MAVIVHVQRGEHVFLTLVGVQRGEHRTGRLAATAAPVVGVQRRRREQRRLLLVAGGGLAQRAVAQRREATGLPALLLVEVLLGLDSRMGFGFGDQRSVGSILWIFLE